MSWTYDHWKTTEPDPFEDEDDDWGEEESEDCECGEDTCVCLTPRLTSPPSVSET